MSNKTPSVSTLEQLEKLIDLKSEERAWFERATDRDLSFLIPPQFSNKLDVDAIRRQFVPNVHEFDESSFTDDPQNEHKFTVSPFLVHRYKNRVALTITDKCFGYCRHCFRRRFTSNAAPCTKSDIERASAYIKSHSEIEEILITGGDPLTLSNGFLKETFRMLREASPNLIIRLCTRCLSVYPERFDDELLSIMSQYNEDAPLFLLTQFNSRHEFSEETSKVAKKITRLGIAIFNQSVLLRGVNDTKDEFVALCHLLLQNRIKPYYAFQGDDVKGTEHLIITIDEALKLEDEVRDELSGLEMPTFMKDRDNGRGKIPLIALKASKNA